MKLLPFVVVVAFPALASAQPRTVPARSLRQDLECAPLSLPAAPASALLVVGGTSGNRIMFGPGDAFVINAGRAQGIKAGQEYFVRRVIPDNLSPVPEKKRPVNVHTAGWVRIVDVADHAAVASVVQACDGILAGDYLDPYSEAVVPEPAAEGQPDFAHPLQIVMGDEMRQTGGAGSLMLVDGGSDAGVTPGQQVTIYRQAVVDGAPSAAIGTGEILSVRPKTALLRIATSHQAVYVGDYVAIHK